MLNREPTAPFIQLIHQLTLFLTDNSIVNLTQVDFKTVAGDLSDSPVGLLTEERLAGFSCYGREAGEPTT